MLDRLPPSLQQCLLLEWLSPETVWTAVRASGVLRRLATSSLPAVVQFRAADGEVLSDACVRWFRNHGRQLCLWTYITKENLYGINYAVHMSNGKCHRDGDLPAKISDGLQVWYQHGKFHREGDLPAAIRTGWSQGWYQHGKLHRDGDLPAIIRADGTQRWCQNGKLHRNGDLPAVIWASGAQEWYQNGDVHRDGDLPAVIWPDGTQLWYLHGSLHREGDLPAVIWANGLQEWWLHGKQVRYQHGKNDLPATN